MSSRMEGFFKGLSFLHSGTDTESIDRPRKIALDFLNALAGRCGREDEENLPGLFRNAIRLIHQEMHTAMSSGSRKAAIEALEALTSGDAAENRTAGNELAEALWAALFPEALHLDPDPDMQIEKLRESRIVTITRPVSDPIEDPASQIIFTSNVLLSPPMAGTVLPEDEELRDIVEGAEKVAVEKQSYWYDHPVPVGVPAANDEAVYGLKGLSEMLSYEKNRGSVPPDSRLTVLLSVSVTHQGLREWALPWLKAQLGASDEGSLEGLDVFAFTEDSAGLLVDLLAPWLPGEVTAGDMKATFGVDGEYGRHYSLLKALPALLAVINGGKEKATFKIDLDQVFPQDVLAAETGKSTLEHFTTDLWGAEALDADGHKLEMGMIAGALVNEKDIDAGLFTPDIPWPGDLPEGEDLLFFKLRPMAVSTRAELMTRYGYDGFPDGRTTALQRIHVTGGTNGIRFDALRRHRPFTPSFVGRAEDQAYILSVLGDRSEESTGLAYVHASGLFMRHDKEAFATDAVKAGKAGSYVGDLVRLFVFSEYAKMLPGGQDGVKRLLDPFTGCFISPMPATLAFLRLALHMADPEAGSEAERTALMDLAIRRLDGWVNDPGGSRKRLASTLSSERRCWNGFYSALDSLEADLASGDPRALEAKAVCDQLMEKCRITG